MLYIDEQQQRSRSQDSENAQCNLEIEIVQIFRLCGKYIHYIYISLQKQSCYISKVWLLQLCNCSYYYKAPLNRQMQTDAANVVHTTSYTMLTVIWCRSECCVRSGLNFEAAGGSLYVIACPIICCLRTLADLQGAPPMGPFSQDCAVLASLKMFYKHCIL